MVLLFQSIPFSLAVFWRFLIVFPFILVPAFVLIVGTGLIFVPIAAFIFWVAYNFSTLVGIRAGLGAANYGNSPALMPLIKWAMIFTFFQMACSLFLLALAWAVVTAARMLGYDEVSAIWSLAFLQDMTSFLWGFATGAPLLAGVTAFLLLASTALWAMSLVPQAAAARSCSPKAPPSNLLAGFGSGFFGLFIVTTLSSALILWTDATNKMFLFFGLLLKWAYNEYMGLLELPPSLTELLPGLFGMFIWVWASCWVFGAAALAYMRHLRRSEGRSETRSRIPVTTADDIRALREARDRAREGISD